MTAQDYPVTFPYGATSAPYSPTRPHRGADRACPTGTPIVIGNKTIGLTGATGLVTGPHLHTQAGSDPQTQQTFNPAPYEFKPGKVTATGNASQWGNYITMNVPGGYITYAHLSQINVNIGDIIGGTVSYIAPETIKSLFADFSVPGPTADQITYYSKHPGGYTELYLDLLKYNHNARKNLEKNLGVKPYDGPALFLKK